MLIAIAAVMFVGCGPPPPDISIHKAVSEKNIQAVKQHLAAGTDVNAKCLNNAKTPLHIAANVGHNEITELLIANGADVNAKGLHSRTPLHYAAIGGSRKFAELLIANGADVNAKSKIGLTSLHNAAVHGQKDFVELLIANGADVNATKGAGGTALHSAANFGHKEVVELLITKGADVNAKEEDGRTPLDSSERDFEDDSPEDKAKKKEIADLLRKHGAKTSEELKAEGK